MAGGVGLERPEPGLGCRRAVGSGDGRDDGLEVGLPTGQPDLALPCRIGQLHGGGGKLVGLSSEVLYTMTLTRAETPTHLPSGESYLD